MQYFVHILDESGKFELIRSDFAECYPHLDFTVMPTVSQAKGEAVLATRTAQTVFLNGEFQTLPPRTPQELDETAQHAALAQRRLEIIAEINRTRDKKSASGVFVEPLNKWIDSDQASKTKLLGLKAVFDSNENFTVNWTCADNSEIELNKSAVEAVIGAILTTENQNHQTARLHKARLQTHPAPEYYRFDKGWALNYEDFKNGLTAEDLAFPPHREKQKADKTEQGVTQ